MKTVKEWLQSKTPQFSVSKRDESGKICEVYGIKNKYFKRLWSGALVKRDFYFGITEFSEDLIHITFFLVLPKINLKTGEVESADTSNEYTCEFNDYSNKMTEITLQQDPNYFKQKEYKNEG
jgi:hypothetical protein